MRYLLWNTHNNKNINEYIYKIVLENNIDIIALTEYTGDCNQLITELNTVETKFEKFYTEGADGIEVIGKNVKANPGPQEKHYSILTINDNTILCVVHLASRIYSNNEEKRKSYARRIVGELDRFEKEKSIENTIIVGDINSTPYEPTCIYADCFHGIPYHKEAKRLKRKWAEVEYKMFYNPMWQFLGDISKIPGTFYYAGGEVDTTYWYILDQVMFRPSMYEGFKNESLKIITNAREINLLDEEGRPDITISDHLPIMFEIEEGKYE